MDTHNRSTIYLPVYVPYLLSALMLAFLVGIEFIYRDPLYEASVTAELHMQRDATAATKFVMQALSKLGEAPLYVVLLMLVYN